MLDNSGFMEANAMGNIIGAIILGVIATIMNGEVYADIRDECFYITLVVKMA